MAEYQMEEQLRDYYLDHSLEFESRARLLEAWSLAKRLAPLFELVPQQNMLTQPSSDQDMNETFAKNQRRVLTALTH